MKRLVLAVLPLCLVPLPAFAEASHNSVISVSTTGAAGEYDSGGTDMSVTVRNEVSISGTGRFVAFESQAGTLVAGDVN